MTYEVLLERPAEKALAKLPKDMGRRITKRLEALGTDPRPPGCRKLVSEDNRWRIRVGTYRVVYSIYDELLLVHVINIAHRRDVY